MFLQRPWFTLLVGLACTACTIRTSSDEQRDAATNSEASTRSAAERGDATLPSADGNGAAPNDSLLREDDTDDSPLMDASVDTLVDAEAGPSDSEAGSAYVELLLDPNGTTPLSAELTVVCSTACSIDVDIDGTEQWQVSSNGAQEVHSIPIVGLKPREQYQVNVRASVAGRALPLTQPAPLVTGTLPSPFPVVERLTHDATRTEPGWTLFDLGRSAAYLAMIDEQAEFVWTYLPPAGDVSDARLLNNGHLLFFEGVEIVEMDLLGNEIRRLSADDELGYHHEVVWTERGTFLTLGNDVHSMPNFPIDYDDLQRTDDVEITDDLLLELSAQGDELTRVRFVDMLDPSRVGFDSLGNSARYGTPLDWTHANAIIPTDSGENVVISTRHQDAVFKIGRDGQDLRWILANHSNWSAGFQQYLLQPVGDDFRWPYHQHAPQMTSEGNLMLFDNGVHQASPGDNLEPLSESESRSRAVEYHIDESAMTVEQIWQYEPDPALFSLVLGDADVQATTNNVLMVFGSVDPGSGGIPERQARLIEVSRTGETLVVSDLALRSPEPARGWVMYRAERIPNLR